MKRSKMDEGINTTKSYVQTKNLIKMFVLMSKVLMSLLSQINTLQKYGKHSQVMQPRMFCNYIILRFISLKKLIPNEQFALTEAWICP